MYKLKALVNQKKVIVVGPSPHLENKSMGSLIDSYDIVCRLNEVFPTDMEKDYGSRTDIAFWSIPNAGLKDFREMIKQEREKMSNIKLVVCPRHSLHVTPYHEGNFNPNNNIFKNYESLEIENDFCHIGDELNTEFEKSIGCHPSVGTLALLSLLKCDFKKLYICGMSFYQTKRRYNKSAEKVYTAANQGITPAFCYMKSGHDTGKEIKYLQNPMLVK